MKNRPQNFFIIWTNAPLTQAETNPNSAMLSKRFCKWAKDTLARGLDPVFGIFPPNVYVFDFFSKLTDANGFMLLQYAYGPNDPHPNAAATALVAPQLVNEMFDHSIAYEQIFGIKKLNEIVPGNFHLFQNYPNPFNPKTNINFQISKFSEVNLTVFDIRGREIETLVNTRLVPGTYGVEWDGSNYSSGVYFYKLTAVEFTATKKMVLIK